MEYHRDLTYIGRGKPDMHDDYMTLINRVFGFETPETKFEAILPKLYGREDAPACSSYVVCEQGGIQAAVGAFDHDITVCGHYLKTRGIGNVAVAPECRSKGYMKALMDMAVDEMVKDGVVLSALGGRRQRYGYFSYEKCGQRVSLTVQAYNLRHVFGNERKHTISFRKVAKEDDSALDAIAALLSKQVFVPQRPRNKLFDILVSWTTAVYAGYDGDAFCGYLLVKDASISEIMVENPAILPEFVCAFMDQTEKTSLSVKLPPFDADSQRVLLPLCEGYHVENAMSFTVLHYETVLRAFLDLKNKVEPLPDGELILDIAGRGGRECLRIAIEQGSVAIEPTTAAPTMTLDHLAAMNLLFGQVCPDRTDLPPAVRAWFPLPLYLHHTDAV